MLTRWKEPHECGKMRTIPLYNYSPLVVFIKSVKDRSDTFMGCVLSIRVDLASRIRVLSRRCTLMRIYHGSDSFSDHEGAYIDRRAKFRPAQLKWRKVVTGRRHEIRRLTR